jgi:hypothetical protein
MRRFLLYNIVKNAVNFVYFLNGSNKILLKNIFIYSN